MDKMFTCPLFKFHHVVVLSSLRCIQSSGLDVQCCSMKTFMLITDLQALKGGWFILWFIYCFHWKTKMASKGRIGQGGLAVVFKIDFALSPLPSIFFSWLHKTSNSLRMLPMHYYLDKAFLAQIFLLMILVKHFYFFFCFCCKALISLS